MPPEPSPAARFRPVRAVLVAGGEGRRLGELARDLPKPMLPYGGRPLLAHQADLAAAAGVSRITVLAGYRAEVIEERRAELTPAGTELEILREARPAGSGGCLLEAGLHRRDETLLVIFGDVVLGMDVAALVDFHRHRRALATAVVHPNDHPADSDLVAMDPRGRVTTLHPKPHPDGLVARNLVTAGVFVLEPEALERADIAAQAAEGSGGEPRDLVHDLLAPLVEARAPVYGYATTEYLKDMGTPARRARTLEDWNRGKVAALHRSRPRPTAFLDRDGTLVRAVPHLNRPDQLELLPGAAEAVARLNRAGALAVVVTNQPVVARGECRPEELETIHAHLEMALGEHGAFLDRIEVCPHHPDRGFAGEVPELKGPCDCRKPAPGMLERAARELPVDLGRAAMFGDSWRDVGAARALGLPAWLLVGDGTGDEGEAPPGGLDSIVGAAAGPAPPVLRADDLATAVDRWLAGLDEAPGATGATDDGP